MRTLNYGHDLRLLPLSSRREAGFEKEFGAKFYRSKVVYTSIDQNRIVPKLAEEKRYTEQECHRKFAVECFNLVWSPLDKKERTKEDDAKMAHAAHASRFHWGEIGTAVEFDRGEWQISVCTRF